MQNSALLPPQPPFIYQRKRSGANTPASTSLFLKKRTGGTPSSVASASLSRKKKSRGTPSSVVNTSLSGKKRRGGTPSSAEDDDEDHSIKKDDKDVDYVPVTNQTVNNIMEGKDGGEMSAIIANRCNVFMERAFPPGEEQAYSLPQSKCAAIKSCRPKKELDYITYIVQNWQVGMEIRKMDSGPERDSLLDFCREHPLGNK